MLSLEVLIGKLFSIDRFASSALFVPPSDAICINAVVPKRKRDVWSTHIATCEVTTLKHEVWDDPVELRALVAKALLTRAESAKVLGGLGDDVVVEDKIDASSVVL